MSSFAQPTGDGAVLGPHARNPCRDPVEHIERMNISDHVFADAPHGNEAGETSTKLSPEWLVDSKAPGLGGVSWGP